MGRSGLATCVRPGRAQDDVGERLPVQPLLPCSHAPAASRAAPPGPPASSASGPYGPAGQPAGSAGAALTARCGFDRQMRGGKGVEERGSPVKLEQNCGGRLKLASEQYISCDLSQFCIWL